jgi:hypothetical protein
MTIPYTCQHSSADGVPCEAAFRVRFWPKTHNTARTDAQPASADPSECPVCGTEVDYDRLQRLADGIIADDMVLGILRDWQAAAVMDARATVEANAKLSCGIPSGPATVRGDAG